MAPSAVDAVRGSSTEGFLLVSVGRVERPMPYFPVVYYHVLKQNRETGDIREIGDLASEVLSFRYFNGMHFSGTGKQAVVHLVRLPAGTYWLSAFPRRGHSYLPGIGGGAMPGGKEVHIVYRLEVVPGKLTYGGELLINSYDLSSNASVTVSDEFERDIRFVAEEHPYVRELETKKGLATPQE